MCVLGGARGARARVCARAARCACRVLPPRATPPPPFPGGDSLPEAFAQQALGMWGYMTDLRGVALVPAAARVIEAEGVDLCSLLFAWVDGALAAYGMDYFIGREVAVTHWGRDAPDAPGAPPGRFRIRAVARGEIFEFGRHAQGTEVKAMTYSNMQIFDADGAVYSANDAIDAAAAAAAAAAAPSGEAAGAGAGAAAAAAAPAADAAADAGGAPPPQRAGLRKGRCDIYTIVDI